MKFPIGTRVKVREGAGLDSGREGIVVSSRILPTNGRGVPDIGEGHYNPFCPSKEAVVQDNHGDLFTMFWSCLLRV
jgi:hypothetical protein